MFTPNQLMPLLAILHSAMRPASARATYAPPRPPESQATEATRQVTPTEVDAIKGHKPPYGSLHSYGSHVLPPPYGRGATCCWVMLWWGGTHPCQQLLVRTVLQ